MCNHIVKQTRNAPSLSGNYPLKAVFSVRIVLKVLETHFKFQRSNLILVDHLCLQQLQQVHKSNSSS